MAIIPISSLPSAASALLTDELPANESGTTKKITVNQLQTLFDSNFLQISQNLNDVASKPTSRTNLSVPATSTFAGDPNTHVAGAVGDFVVDIADANALYMCTTAGNAASAVWTLQGGGSSGPIVAGTGLHSAQGGDGSESASGDYSFAYGLNGTNATGLNSFSFGDGCSSSADYSISFGLDALSGSIGCFSLSSGQNLSTQTAAQADNSFAMGASAATGGIGSFAFGGDSTTSVSANGNYSLAFGSNSTNSLADYSLAFGNRSITQGAYSFCFGDGSTSVIQANGAYSFCFGNNGTIASSTASHSFAFGTQTVTGLNFSSAYSLAFGDTAVTGSNKSSPNSFSFGLNTTSDGISSFAFGNHALTAGNYAFAFGDGSANGLSATGISSFAFGNSQDGPVSSTGFVSFAVGDNITAHGDGSVCFGIQSESRGNYSFCFGQNGSLTLGIGSFAWGSIAVANNNGSWVINDGVLTGNNDTAAGQMNLSFTNGYRMFGGSLSINTAGSGLAIQEGDGSNAKQGVATLTAGTVTVTNSAITANSRIFLTAQDNNTVGALRVSARNPGTDFTITGTVTDSGVVAYLIMEPA